jgi:hypothetical protein
MLEVRWNGPRIDFGFCKCPICSTSLVNSTNAVLSTELAPVKKLHDEVRRKALLRLQYDGKEDAVEGSEDSKAAFAMHKVRYSAIALWAQT